MHRNLLAKILSLPTGFSRARFRGRTYSVSKIVYNDGLSFKVYAEELGGKDFISFNYYQIGSNATLKPCEMPEAKVEQFLNELSLTEPCMAV